MRVTIDTLTDMILIAATICLLIILLVVVYDRQLIEVRDSLKDLHTTIKQTYTQTCRIAQSIQAKTCTDKRYMGYAEEVGRTMQLAKLQERKEHLISLHNSCHRLREELATEQKKSAWCRNRTLIDDIICARDQLKLAVEMV